MCSVCTPAAFTIMAVSSLTVAVGGTALLRCCAKDNRKISVKEKMVWTWIHASSRGDLTTLIREQPGANYIMLANFSQADTGQYYCEVSAPGFDRRIGKISVAVDCK